MVAIPQLKKEITPSEPIVIEDSESEGESPEEHAPSEEENVVPQEKPSPATKYCLIPGHAKSIDTDCQVVNNSHTIWLPVIFTRYSLT